MVSLAGALPDRRIQAEYICLFERLFPAIGMPWRAATGTTCDCARQKLRCLMTDV
jgi:hypothetical protein